MKSMLERMAATEGSLAEENSRLEQERDELKAQRAVYRADIADLTAERDRYKAALEDIVRTPPDTDTEKRMNKRAFDALAADKQDDGGTKNG